MKIHHRRAGLLAFLALAFSFSCAHSKPTTMELRDWTGRGFAPDLVTYRVPAKAAAKFRVLDGNGKPLPVQVTSLPGQKMAELNFVAAITPGQAATYTLDDAGGKIPESPVQVVREEGTQVLSNSLLAIKVPEPVTKKFATPVAAGSLPAPILAFRGADGPWRGSSRILSERKVKILSIQVTAKGPVYAEVSYTLEFENGGFYHATLRVIDQVPLVNIREEFDARELSGRDYWELNLTQGWKPDTMDVASSNGNGSVDRGKDLPLTELGETPQPIQPPWVITGGNAWGRARSHFGLFEAEKQKANPTNYPVAGFVPLHRGDWRRAIGVEISSSADQQVALKLPISARHSSWLTEISSETSPMSVNEHDPDLPDTYSRRVWGLLLAPPPIRPIIGTSAIPSGVCYDARLLYGVVGLDRYKDYTLRWPDKKTAYPRMTVQQKDLPQFLQTAEQSPLAAELKKFYFVSKDEEVARKNLQTVKSRLAGILNYMLSTPTLGHHQVWQGEAQLAEDVLSWPNLPTADREEIRAQLALITYLHVEPDVMGHGKGAHLGNPNMSMARQAQMCNFMALLPDHPMYTAWRDYMARFLEYKMGINTAPGGGWFEFGSAYHIHSLNGLTRAMFGLDAAGAPNTKALFDYIEPNWSYYFNLLKPYDSRWYSRTIPGGANSPPGYPADFYEPAGLLAKQNPQLAAQLLWAWDNNERPLIGSDMGVFPALGRPWLKSEEPRLTSEIYPGVGVVFRAHQGPDETYMFLRSGYNWSHWYTDDQNSFILASRGGLLVPDQPFQYYSRESGKPPLKDFNLYNNVRFGSSANEYAFGWPDTNVLDHAFGATVDYAWASTAFPEWYIEPGRKSGYGPVRDLDKTIPQQQGAFNWNRQVMFLKGKTAASPNYFVFRDTTRGPGKLASWWNIDLLGRRENIKTGPSGIAVDTEFATKLQLLFPGKSTASIAMEEDDMGAGIASPGFRPWIARAQGKPVSPNWFRNDGKPASAEAPPNREKHVMVRLSGGPGEEYFWLAYPHREGEAVPTVIQLAPGALKIPTPESTDYVFTSPEPIKYAGEDVVFEGCSGAVRVRDDEVTLAFTGGSGRIGYKGYILEGTAPFERTIKIGELAALTEKITVPASPITYQPLSRGKTPVKSSQEIEPGVIKTIAGDTTEYRSAEAATADIAAEGIHLEGRNAAIRVSPGTVRFVALERAYAQLSSGAVGVRGMGPFDITITDKSLRAVVDGDTRTIVVSKPKGLLRPMYHVDGKRWYAGFPDDDAPYEAMKSPQFSLALGVTQGRHELAVDEWTYPALPPLPGRTEIGGR